MVSKSIQHGKLLSICCTQQSTVLTVELFGVAVNDSGGGGGGGGEVKETLVSK